MTRQDRQRNRRSRGQRMLAVAEVAERLNVSVKTVRRLISNRELEAYQIRRQLRVSEADLAAYLVGQRVQ